MKLLSPARLADLFRSCIARPGTPHPARTPSLRPSWVAAIVCLAMSAGAFAQDYNVDPDFAPSASLGGWTRQYFGTSDEKTIGFARASAAVDAGFVFANGFEGN